MLRPGADVGAIRSGLQAWEDRAIPDETAGEARVNAGDDQDWHIVNLEDVHLGQAQAAAMAPGNDRASIVTFAEFLPDPNRYSPSAATFASLPV